MAFFKPDIYVPNINSKENLLEVPKKLKLSLMENSFRSRSFVRTRSISNWSTWTNSK